MTIKPRRFEIDVSHERLERLRGLLAPMQLCVVRFTDVLDLQHENAACRAEVERLRLSEGKAWDEARAAAGHAKTARRARERQTAAAAPAEGGRCLKCWCDECQCQPAAPECRCDLGAVNCELHRLGAQPAAPARTEPADDGCA